MKKVSLSLKCPFCGKSLMNETHKINDYPSINLAIETKSGKGLLWLCSLYGCYDHEADIAIENSEVVKLNCPHCHSSLIRDILCKKCNAPMVGMNINTGGKANVCSRKGCDNHYVLFEDINNAITLFYDNYGYLE